MIGFRATHRCSSAAYTSSLSVPKWEEYDPPVRTLWVIHTATPYVMARTCPQESRTVNVTPLSFGLTAGRCWCRAEGSSPCASCTNRPPVRRKQMRASLSGGHPHTL